MGATAAIVFTVADVGLKYLSQTKQADVAKAEGAYQAAVYRQNASIADQQGADALLRGTETERRFRQGTKQEIGASRAALAAQGVDVNTGSALDVQASEAAIGELDALTIRNNAAREAWGFQIDAVNNRQAAKLAEFSGAQTAAAYKNAATSTLLTGAANTYGLFSEARRNKADLRGSQYRPKVG